VLKGSVNPSEVVQLSVRVVLYRWSTAERSSPFFL